MHRSKPNFVRHTLLAIGFVSSLIGRTFAGDLSFDFRTSPTSGATQVSPSTTYDDTRGYGFLTNIGLQPGKTTVFAAKLSPGNYDVTLTFGDRDRATSNTVRAESRRLLVEKLDTKPGEFISRTFTINVRDAKPAADGKLKLSDRENGPPLLPDWDDKLTLEFNGSDPGVASVQIKPNTSAVTVFVAGDSTVTDQPREPFTAWAQILPRFFKPGVAIANHAWSGLALYSFRSQGRLDKVLSEMKKGDYLLIQFGHNDQKDKSTNAGPFTTYAANLKKYIDAARGKGGIPVLVTPMERRRWDGATFRPTLADYAEAVRQVGKQEGVPVIDLNAMSVKFYNALGPDASTAAFVFYPANTFPGEDRVLKDNTHHNAYGAYELCRCVLEGLRSALPDLAQYLTDDAGSFDPSHPDDPKLFTLPRSPLSDKPEKPAGS